MRLLTMDIYSAIAAAIGTAERAQLGINNVVIGQLPLEPLTDSTDWDPNDLLDILLITDGQEADKVTGVGQGTAGQQYRVRVYYFHKLVAGENAVDVMTEKLTAVSALLSQITMPVRFNDGVIQSVLPGPTFKVVDTGETTFFRGVGLNCSVGWIDLTVNATSLRVTAVETGGAIAVEHHYTSGYENRNLTADGATDWMAVLGWGVGDGQGTNCDRKALAPGVDRSFTDYKLEGCPPPAGMGWTMSWAGTSPQSCSDATYSENPQVDNMAYGMSYAPWDNVASTYELTFDVKALTARQRMILCIPVKNCQLKVSFTLGGVTEIVEIDPANDSGGIYNGCDKIITVDFSAAKDGQRMYVRFYDVVHGTAYDSPWGFRYVTLKPWPLVPALMLHYPFEAAPVDDVILDDSTYGNNGENVGSTWADHPVFGPHQMFDGVDDYVKGAGITLANGDDFTIAFWLGQGDVDNEGKFYFHLYGTDGSHICIRYTSGLVRFYIVDAPQAVAILAAANSPITDGLPHHVICVLEGTTMRIFIDNVADGRASAAGLGARSGNQLRFGCYDNGTPQYFIKGPMRDVQIYSRALTEAERAIVYAGGVVDTE